MLFEPPQPPVAFPHPLITEVLYAVPTEKSAGGDLALCDANPDATRDATGDEFVELINPHARPIQLRGYTLSDQPGTGKKPKPQLSFTFPPLELKPGEVVVVFNGYKQRWTGPVGDSTRAAPPNDRFRNAYVFTMRVASSRSGLANGGDWVLLSAPDGRAVECVRWGQGDGEPVRGTPVVEAPAIDSGSIQRDGIAGEFVPHRSLGAPYDGPFSPGLFETRVPAPPTSEDPGPAAAEPAPNTQTR